MPPSLIFSLFFFFFNDTATTEIYTLSLHDALPIWIVHGVQRRDDIRQFPDRAAAVLGLAAGMGRDAPDEYLDAPDTLSSGHDLAAVAGRLCHKDIFGLESFGLDQRARCRASDLFLGNVQLRDAERRAFGACAELPEGVVGEIGPALHVVDARAEGAVALDPERQAVDEAERVYRIEMAQHQDARRILTPGRSRHQMIAAAVLSRDAFDGRRQFAVAVGDERRQPVDLLRRFGRRFDFNPSADAVEDGVRIEGIAGGHRVAVAC